MWIEGSEGFPITNSYKLVTALLRVANILSGNTLQRAIAGNKQTCSLLIIIYDDESGQGNVEVGDCSKLIGNTLLTEQPPRAVLTVDESFVEDARKILEAFRQ
jgi:hypothetical protein